MSWRFWLVLAALLAAWLSMNLWTAPRIEELSGGLRLLEMRFTGYSFDEAQDFVAAIGNEGAALYLGAQLRLDTLFPPLLAAVLFLGYRRLFPGLPGLIIGTASLSSVAVDYLENAAVAAMLRVGADGLTPEMAATASRWTLTKWGFALVGALTLIIGIVVRIRRRMLRNSPVRPVTGDSPRRRPSACSPPPEGARARPSARRPPPRP